MLKIKNNVDLKELEKYIHNELVLDFYMEKMIKELKENKIMDLWIRSQDKESLTKVSNIQYSYQKGDLYTDVRGKHHIGTYYDNLKILGTYETKERALKVLDEIQKILKPQLIIKDSGKIIGSFEDTIIREGATYELKELSTFVYQMPEK